MKKVLFVTDTCYPDSSATTTIVMRTAEALAKLGYCVDIYPTEISGSSFSYPDEYNGVKIIKTVIEPRRHICVEQCRSAVHSIEKILDATDYDYIFSVAVAFEVNLLVHQAFRGKKYTWFPMSYDPYAFDPHITSEQKNEFVKLELNALKDATKIFFLAEFAEDYVGSPIEDKIVYFNLPCMRPIAPDRTKKAIKFDDAFINCVFLGDFYYGIENTDFIFRLFEKMNKPIRLYTVGNLGDYKDTVDLWKKKLGDKYIQYKRISQEEAHNVMLDCDVLVSMGHDSSNMCPSKVIDFAASGKPILHIQKIRNCCAKKYLERYPNKHFIYQNDDLSVEKIHEVELFILTSKNKERLSFETVRNLYRDFTMEALIEKIINAFNNK